MARVLLGNIMGPKGDPGPQGESVQGPQGEPGHTPVKGVDYFTEEDIKSIRGITESTEHPGCYYCIVNEEVEWINPPMLFGVEYRTTERWNGKAVYTSLVDCGICTSPHKDVFTELTCELVIRHYGRIGGVSVPMNNVTLDNQWSAWANVINHSDKVRVTVYNGTSLDGESAEMQVWYTKS